MKLWDMAETTEDGTAVIKVLDLPYDIGRVEVRMEGLSDGPARRSALEGFGNYIRERVDNKIGEDSVTARAQQKAASVSNTAGQLLGGAGDDSTRPGGEITDFATEMADTEAVETSNALTLSPEALALRARWIRGTIEEVATNLDALKRELEGLNAYLEVFNASTHKKTPQPSEDATLEGEDDG